jgi:hypothetical protein
VPRQGVTTRPAIKGRADIVPRMTIPARGDSLSAVAFVDALKISNFLISPVIEVNKKAKITQEVRDGWDRVIKESDFSNADSAGKPLIVSARKKWNIYQDEINIIEKAYLLDGSKYLEYLLQTDKLVNLPMIVLFNKTEEEELIIRRQISGASTFSIHDIKNKVGTDAPRLAIDENWAEVTIISDPFVIKTGMGYTAAINVLAMKSNAIHHIIVGAKSLSNELEIVRTKNGSLVGVALKIRKQSTEQKSLYELKIK